MPIAALRVEQPVVDGLLEVGIERVGELYDLPRSTLPARFGSELLLRLDQALGQAIETIDPVRPTPPPAVERAFDGPTDRIEAIELTVRELLEELADQLRTRECGARSIEITLKRSDLEPEVLTLTMGRPSRDAKHVWSLARPKLERAHLGFGVEAVHVRTKAVGRVRQEQGDVVAGAQGEIAPADIDRTREELLDTLGNRIGRDRVRRAALVDSHLPERAAETYPADLTPAFAERVEIGNDRPTVLFDHPIAAEVVALTPDGPVHRVKWRGGDEPVTVCLGPERIAPEWWRRAHATRDYFAVRTESGRWLWVARGLENGRWYVHGVWA